MKRTTTPVWPMILWSLAIILAVSFNAYSQTPPQSISMTLSTQKALPERWLGYDGQNTVRNGESWAEPNLISHHPMLLPKVIRYPGNSTFFDWKRGWFIDSPLLPTKLANYVRQPNYLENFKVVLDLSGAKGMLTLNMVTSTLQDQLAMLKHADSIGIDVKYVELGSEFYLDPLNNDDMGEGVDLVNQVYPTAKSYALTCNTWIDSIHYYFPQAKVAVIGSYVKTTAGRRATWNDSVRTYLNGREDAWTFHIYQPASTYVDGYSVSEGISSTIIPDWLNQPGRAFTVLTTSSIPKISPNKDIWITEYNLLDPGRPLQGRWGHGLYDGLMTLRLLDIDRIKNLVCHTTNGSAIFGMFFDDDEGFSFSETADTNYTLYTNPPPTTPWGLTAAGHAMKLISEAANGKTSATRLNFLPNNQVTAYIEALDSTFYYDALYGWNFSDSVGSNAIIMNVSSVPYTINSSAIFPNGGTYISKYRDPLTLIANDDSLTIVTGSLSGDLVIQPYSITKISTDLVPAAAPAVTISANGATSICAGDSVELDAGPHSYYVWSNGAMTRKIWVKSTGDYWVRSADSIVGYWGADTLHVTVNALPPSPNLILDGARNFCSGDTTTLKINTVLPYGTTYLWSTGDTSANKLVTSSGTYYVTVTDPNGCTSISEQESLIVYALPHPTITVSGPTEFCSDQSTTLQAPPGYLSYQWSNSKNGQTQTVSLGGTYTISVKDSNQCWGDGANAISLTVWDPPVPSISINGGNANFCQGTPVYLSTISGYTVQWQLASNNIAGATDVNYTPASTGTYKVILTDIHGCTKASSGQAITIWSNPVPGINVSGGTSICQGQSTTLSAANSGYVSYLWSTGETTTSIMTSQSGNYTLTVTDANGCVGSSVPKAITVNALPTPTISAGGATEFCNGSNVVLSVNQTYTSYAWSPSGFGQTKTVSSSGSYYCTVTDVNGCQAASNTISVNVHTLPTPTVTSSGGNVFCSNAGVYLSTPVTGYNYQWLKGTATLSGQTNQSYYPSSTGNYKVRITDGLGCTALSGAYSATVNTPPSPSITGTTVICDGSSATLSANTTYTTYMWSTGATTQSINITLHGTYTLTVTNTNGCSGTATTTVNPGTATVPVLSASGPTEFCSGGSVTLSVTTTYSSYSWSNNKTTSTNTVNTSGSYTCTITDANGCTATSAPIDVNVHVLPAPVVLTSSGQTTFCDNAGVYLTADAAGYSYQWYKGISILTGETNQTYLTPSTGSYKVQITDGIGCSATASPLSVVVNGHPSPSITGNTFICGSNPVSLSASTAYLTYLWSNGATTQSTSVTEAGTYNLTVTDVNGCSGSTSINVQAGSAGTPVLSASGATEFCNGGSVTLSVTPAYNSYLWSNTKTTATISVTSSGSYTCTVTDANGCTATSAPLTVNVHTVPTPVVSSSSGANTWCTGESVYLTTDAVGYNYQWYKGSTSQSGATNQNFTPTVTGSYKVRVTDNIGCSATSGLYAITINSSLTPSITGTTSICNGSSTTLSVSGTYATYLWSTGATTQSINVSAAGTYTVTVSNSSGCSGSTSATVTSSTITIPTITASGAVEFCSGGTVTLSVSPTTYSTYSWTGGGTTSTKSVNSSGTYTCTVSNSSGCTAVSNAITVNVHTLTTPVVTTSTGATTFCSNAGVYLTTSSAGYNYQWMKGATNLSGATNQNYTPSSTGNYKVKVTDNIGCSSTSSSLSITINTAPAPSITGVSTICNGQSISISANTAYATYLWSTGATTQSITVSTPATYSLTVTNTSGCSATTSATVPGGSATVPALVASGPTEFCNGGSVTLSTNPATYSSYSWSNSKTTATNTITASGNYSCTVTDANGCTATSAPMNVNVHTLPTPIVSTSNGQTTFCDNAGVYLTNDAVGYSYQWMKGTAALTGATNQNYTPTSTGSYKVQITDGMGCSATAASLSITINASTTPGITGPSTICGSNPITLSANNVYSSYLWSTGATTQTISVSNPGTYSLTVTNTSGCNGTASYTVTAGSATVPALSASGATDFCSGGSVTLSTNPATYSSYAWSNSKTTATVSVNTSGTYYCVVTDASGCTAQSNSVTVNVHSVPTPTVTTSNGQTVFCINGGVYLTTSATGYNYQWLKGSATLAGATNQNYSPTVTASYKVRITDNIGCSATSSSLSVTVNSAAAPTITGANTVCTGSQATISANTVYTTYLWSTGATTQSINISSGGNYSVTVTNASGCTGSASKTITESTPPAPYITAGGATEFCDGGNVNLQANPVSSSYLWSTGAVMQSITASSSGSFSVTVTDANGCTGTSAPLVVTEYPVPGTTITPSGPTTWCADATTNYISGPDGYTYQWKKGTNTLTGETNRNYYPTSTGTYKLTTTDSHGCSATSGTGISITVNSLPNANLSASGSLNLCGGATKTINVSTGVGYVYVWYKDNVVITGATASSYVANQAGTYTVLVTNTSTGCTKLSNAIVLTSNCKEAGEDMMDLPENTSMELYPIPASTSIHVNAAFAGQDDGEARVEVRDIVGALVYTQKVGVVNGQMELDVLFDERYASGLYFMRATMNDDVITKRFIITIKGN
ncbi:MAG: T9SS type A sorting domain-containing protein [Bacteroidetes bacterium]|nr:T9SS type A sorting domain-containing protein [Bacteroidota bacterium]